MALTTKQATLSFGINVSIWLFHVSVLSIIIPKNFMLVVLDFILLSQPTLTGICELLLVKNCMKLVLSKLNDNKFALNQLLISVMSHSCLL